MMALVGRRWLRDEKSKLATSASSTFLGVVVIGEFWRGKLSPLAYFVRPYPFRRVPRNAPHNFSRIRTVIRFC